MYLPKPNFANSNEPWKKWPGISAGPCLPNG